jgi:hypothetical protein
VAWISYPSLELIDHLAALIPPPRRHRHRYHGVLAPNAPLREAVIAFGRELAEATDSPSEVSSPPPTPAFNARSPARYLWVMLPAAAVRVAAPGLTQLRRGHLPAGRRVCLIAFITEAAPVERILLAFGEPPRPPPTTPAWPPCLGRCSRADAGLGSPPTARPGLRARSAHSVVAAVSLRRRCSPTCVPAPRRTAPESPRTPQRLRLRRPQRPSAPLLGVDHTSRPRYRPLPSLPGRSGWLGFPIRYPSSDPRQPAERTDPSL